MHYHLPGLFEFYDFYSLFLNLYTKHREYFYDWCEIGSIYGSPYDCIWGGGRVGFGDDDPYKILKLMHDHAISARLTFSNSLLEERHLKDPKCNGLCRLFSGCTVKQNGIIVHSDLLLQYLQTYYPTLYFVSSTTKVITDFNRFTEEAAREDFRFIVPDFRLNPRIDAWSTLLPNLRKKVEFLCNECCWFGCKDRKECYRSVSVKNLGEDVSNFSCTASDAYGGYRFSKAQKNPGFIGIDDILNTYRPMGYSNFKIEGRGLGSAILLEFLLYYMTKPEYQLLVREEIYLNSTLDLF